MHRIAHSQQTRLFDPFDNLLLGKIRKRLIVGWHILVAACYKETCRVRTAIYGISAIICCRLR